MSGSQTCGHYILYANIDKSLRVQCIYSTYNVAEILFFERCRQVLTSLSSPLRIDETVGSLAFKSELAGGRVQPYQENTSWECTSGS